ncbi:MAG: ABC transporter ATP-binding protein/permease, partial [Oscillospiraceae bacterium]|nr:ABC transporter ATP-binding protein/permease [Oscillospiraceae bacterium]
MILKQKKYAYPDMVAMSITTSPLYSALFAAKYIADALIPVFSIFITASFINSALAVYNKKADISSVYMPVVLLAAIMAYNATINTLMNFIECKRSIHFRKKLMPEMLEKQAKLEYRHIEDPETADLIERVCPKFYAHVWDMYSQVLGAVSLVIYITGVLAALFWQVWWLSVCMLVSLVPVFFVSMKTGRQSYDASRELSKTERRMNYLSDVQKSREAVEERSIYGYTGNLNEQYEKNFDFAYKLRLKVNAKNFMKWKTSGLIVDIYTILVMFAMMVPVSAGHIDVGTFIGLMGGVFGLMTKMSWSSGIIDGLAQKREFLKDLTQFMRLEEHEEATEPPKPNMGFEKIEFKNVGFKYPGTKKQILDGISLAIEEGRHYSLVGQNGAGKSTIIKLLTGLYTDYEGEILVDGRPLCDFSQAELKGLSCVVYQDFAKYYISLCDNISIAGTNVENAIELVGLSDTVEKLKDGLDTPLGKIQQNGVDLSGGEWQRVAMARCVASNAPLKILDEPTAALDPVSESAVYTNFENISKGKT